MVSTPQFQMSFLQAYHLGKCLTYCGKKCWEWTKQEEQRHREIEKFERLKESVLKQLMIIKEQERIRKEKELMNDDDDEDYDDVLKILENINIDEIIKEFQIK